MSYISFFYQSVDGVLFILCWQRFDDDAMSVYVFGEEEDTLREAAHENDGFLSHEHLQNHFGKKEIDKVGCSVRSQHSLPLSFPSTFLLQV